MKTVKYRLILDVEFDRQDTTKMELRHQMNQVVRDALNNGTLTGETSATVERYEYSVKEILS